MTDRLLRITDVCAKVGLARPTIYRLQRAGRFPIAVSLTAIGLTGSGSRWSEAEIDAWIEAQKAKPRALAPAVRPRLAGRRRLERTA